MSGQANPSTQTILSVIFLPVESRWCKCLCFDSTNVGKIIGLSGRSSKMQRMFKLFSEIKTWINKTLDKT